MHVPIGEVGDKVAFATLIDQIKAVPGYTPPTAFAVGVATTTVNSEGHELLLDCWYPVVNNVVDTDAKTGKWGSAGTAALLANMVEHLDGTATYEVDPIQLDLDVRDVFKPYWGESGHANIDAINAVYKAALAPDPLGLRYYRIFVSFIADVNDVPFAGNPNDEGTPMDMRKAADLWQRLHQLSYRKAKPNEINLDGIFGLPNLVWTSAGPLLPEQVGAARAKLRSQGTYLTVEGPADKFPRLLDYVTISDKVRIADPNRVRLGAYLGDGTTVMHEGFINFNAGTFGKSMVEGRISAGVVVDDGSDIGGGASIMGTLSGGGTERISVGKRSLLGANSGIGISLGDDCIVEAGLYITAGTKVQPIGSGVVQRPVRAAELSGMSGMLFRRNSLSGEVEVLPNTKAVTLNPLLHA
jgi:2,3,4,5-tetrahydropyridine-2-carboxylate N-succinyltransferase